MSLHIHCTHTLLHIHIQSIFLILHVLGLQKRMRVTGLSSEQNALLSQAYHMQITTLTWAPASHPDQRRVN